MARKLTEIEEFYIEQNPEISEKEMADKMDGVGINTIKKFRESLPAQHRPGCWRFECTQVPDGSFYIRVGKPSAVNDKNEISWNLGTLLNAINSGNLRESIGASIVQQLSTKDDEEGLQQAMDIINTWMALERTALIEMDEPPIVTPQMALQGGGDPT